MNTITNSSCVRNNKQPNKPKIKNSLVEVCSCSMLEVILKNKVVFKINSLIDEDEFGIVTRIELIKFKN